jgi:hypothetical protein
MSAIRHLRFGKRPAQDYEGLRDVLFVALAAVAIFMLPHLANLVQ